METNKEKTEANQSETENFTPQRIESLEFNSNYYESSEPIRSSVELRVKNSASRYLDDFTIYLEEKIPTVGGKTVDNVQLLSKIQRLESTFALLDPEILVGALSLDDTVFEDQWNGKIARFKNILTKYDESPEKDLDLVFLPQVIEILQMKIRQSESSTKRVRTATRKIADMQITAILSEAPILDGVKDYRLNKSLKNAMDAFLQDDSLGVGARNNNRQEIRNYSSRSGVLKHIAGRMAAGDYSNVEGGYRAYTEEIKNSKRPLAMMSIKSLNLITEAISEGGYILLEKKAEELTSKHFPEFSSRTNTFKNAIQQIQEVLEYSFANVTQDEKDDALEMLTRLEKNDRTQITAARCKALMGMKLNDTEIINTIPRISSSTLLDYGEAFTGEFLSFCIKKDFLPRFLEEDELISIGNPGISQTICDIFYSKADLNKSALQLGLKLHLAEGLKAELEKILLEKVLRITSKDQAFLSLDKKARSRFFNILSQGEKGGNSPEVIINFLNRITSEKGKKSTTRELKKEISPIILSKIKEFGLTSTEATDNNSISNFLLPILKSRKPGQKSEVDDELLIKIFSSSNGIALNLIKKMQESPEDFQLGDLVANIKGIDPAYQVDLLTVSIKGISTRREKLGRNMAYQISKTPVFRPLYNIYIKHSGIPELVRDWASASKLFSNTSSDSTLQSLTASLVNMRNFKHSSIEQKKEIFTTLVPSLDFTDRILKNFTDRALVYAQNIVDSDLVLGAIVTVAEKNKKIHPELFKSITFVRGEFAKKLFEKVLSSNLDLSNARSIIAYIEENQKLECLKALAEQASKPENKNRLGKNKGAFSMKVLDDLIDEAKNKEISPEEFAYMYKFNSDESITKGILTYLNGAQQTEALEKILDINIAYPEDYNSEKNQKSEALKYLIGQIQSKKFERGIAEKKIKTGELFRPKNPVRSFFYTLTPETLLGLAETLQNVDEKHFSLYKVAIHKSTDLETALRVKLAWTKNNGISDDNAKSRRNSELQVILENRANALGTDQKNKIKNRMYAKVFPIEIVKNEDGVATFTALEGTLQKLHLREIQELYDGIKGERNQKLIQNFFSPFDPAQISQIQSIIRSTYQKKLVETLNYSDAQKGGRGGGFSVPFTHHRLRDRQIYYNSRGFRGMLTPGFLRGSHKEFIDEKLERNGIRLARGERYTSLARRYFSPHKKILELDVLPRLMEVVADGIPNDADNQKRADLLSSLFIKDDSDIRLENSDHRKLAHTIISIHNGLNNENIVGEDRFTEEGLSIHVDSKGSSVRAKLLAILETEKAKKMFVLPKLGWGVNQENLDLTKFKRSNAFPEVTDDILSLLETAKKARGAAEDKAKINNKVKDNPKKNFIDFLTNDEKKQRTELLNLQKTLFQRYKRLEEENKDLKKYKRELNDETGFLTNNKKTWKKAEVGKRLRRWQKQSIKVIEYSGGPKIVIDQNKKQDLASKFSEFARNLGLETAQTLSESADATEEIIIEQIPENVIDKKISAVVITDKPDNPNNIEIDFSGSILSLSEILETLGGGNDNYLQKIEISEDGKGNFMLKRTFFTPGFTQSMLPVRGNELSRFTFRISEIDGKNYIHGKGVDGITTARRIEDKAKVTLVDSIPKTGENQEVDENSPPRKSVIEGNVTLNTIYQDDKVTLKNYIIKKDVDNSNFFFKVDGVDFEFPANGIIAFIPDEKPDKNRIKLNCQISDGEDLTFTAFGKKVSIPNATLEENVLVGIMNGNITISRDSVKTPNGVIQIGDSAVQFNKGAETNINFIFKDKNWEQKQVTPIVPIENTDDKTSINVGDQKFIFPNNSSTPQIRRNRNPLDRRKYVLERKDKSKFFSKEILAGDSTYMAFSNAKVNDNRPQIKAEIVFKKNGQNAFESVGDKDFSFFIVPKKQNIHQDIYSFRPTGWDHKFVIKSPRYINLQKVEGSNDFSMDRFIELNADFFSVEDELKNKIPTNFSEISFVFEEKSNKIAKITGKIPSPAAISISDESNESSKNVYARAFTIDASGISYSTSSEVEPSNDLKIEPKRDEDIEKNFNVVDADANDDVNVDDDTENQTQTIDLDGPKVSQQTPARTTLIHDDNTATFGLDFSSYDLLDGTIEEHKIKGLSAKLLGFDSTSVVDEAYENSGVITITEANGSSVNLIPHPSEKTPYLEIKDEDKAIRLKRDVSGYLIPMEERQVGLIKGLLGEPYFVLASSNAELTYKTIGNVMVINSTLENSSIQVNETTVNISSSDATVSGLQLDSNSLERVLRSSMTVSSSNTSTPTPVDFTVETNSNSLKIEVLPESFGTQFSLTEAMVIKALTYGDAKIQISDNIGTAKVRLIQSQSDSSSKNYKFDGNTKNWVEEVDVSIEKTEIENRIHAVFETSKLVYTTEDSLDLDDIIDEFLAVKSDQISVDLRQAVQYLWLQFEEEIKKDKSVFTYAQVVKLGELVKHYSLDDEIGKYELLKRETAGFVMTELQTTIVTLKQSNRFDDAQKLEDLLGTANKTPSSFRASGAVFPFEGINNLSQLENKLAVFYFSNKNSSLPQGNYVGDIVRIINESDSKNAEDLKSCARILAKIVLKKKSLPTANSTQSLFGTSQASNGTSEMPILEAVLTRYLTISKLTPEVHEIFKKIDFTKPELLEAYNKAIADPLYADILSGTNKPERFFNAEPAEIRPPSGFDLFEESGFGFKFNGRDGLLQGLVLAGGGLSSDIHISHKRRIYTELNEDEKKYVANGFDTAKKDLAGLENVRAVFKGLKVTVKKTFINGNEDAPLDIFEFDDQTEGDLVFDTAKVDEAITFLSSYNGFEKVISLLNSIKDSSTIDELKGEISQKRLELDEVRSSLEKAYLMSDMTLGIDIAKKFYEYDQTGKVTGGRNLSRAFSRLADVVKNLDTNNIADYYKNQNILVQSTPVGLPGSSNTVNVSEIPSDTNERIRYLLTKFGDLDGLIEEVKGNELAVDISVWDPDKNAYIAGINGSGKTSFMEILNQLGSLEKHFPDMFTNRLFDNVDYFITMINKAVTTQDTSRGANELKALARVLEILKQIPAGKKCLVFLDEVGKGTDPDDASAIVKTVIEEINSLGNKVMSSTHYLQKLVEGIEANSYKAITMEPDTRQPTVVDNISEVKSLGVEVFETMTKSKAHFSGFIQLAKAVRNSFLNKDSTAVTYNKPEEPTASNSSSGKQVLDSETVGDIGFNNTGNTFFNYIVEKAKAYLIHNRLGSNDFVEFFTNFKFNKPDKLSQGQEFFGSIVELDFGDEQAEKNFFQAIDSLVTFARSARELQKITDKYDPKKINVNLPYRDYLKVGKNIFGEGKKEEFEKVAQTIRGVYENGTLPESLNAFLDVTEAVFRDITPIENVKLASVLEMLDKITRPQFKGKIDEFNGKVSTGYGTVYPKTEESDIFSDLLTYSQTNNVQSFLDEMLALVPEKEAQFKEDLKKLKADLKKLKGDNSPEYYQKLADLISAQQNSDILKRILNSSSYNTLATEFKKLIGLEDGTNGIITDELINNKLVAYITSDTAKSENKKLENDGSNYLLSEIEKFLGLALEARDQKWYKANLDKNETPTLTVKNLIPPGLLSPTLEPSHITKQDFVLGNNDVTIMAGGNSSGKTALLRALVESVAIATTTGYAPAEEFVCGFTKVFSNINGGKSSQDQSSFQGEVTNWTTIMDTVLKLPTSEKALVILDEPLSSTSSEDQIALLTALIVELKSRGHKLIISNHNPELYPFLDRLELQSSDSTLTNEKIQYQIYGYPDNATSKYKPVVIKNVADLNPNFYGVRAFFKALQGNPSLQFTKYAYNVISRIIEKRKPNLTT